MLALSRAGAAQGNGSLMGVGGGGGKGASRNSMEAGACWLDCLEKGFASSPNVGSTGELLRTAETSLTFIFLGNWRMAHRRLLLAQCSGVAVLGLESRDPICKACAPAHGAITVRFRPV